MKEFFPRNPTSNTRLLNAGNRVKLSTSRLSLRSPLALSLITFAVAAMLLALAASASKRAERADAPQAISNIKNSVARPITRMARGNARTRVTPFAPTITATLADDILLSAKKNPGGTITYTAVISNTASVGNDAAAVVYTDVLDNNT